MMQDARTILALIISIFSIVGVTIISIVFILVSSGNERKEAAAQVFSGVLPLYGTWVGTLLAFYFAKENFESAREAFQNSSSDALESIPVSAVISNIFFSVSSTSQDDKSKNLNELKEELRQNKRRRLPVLTEAGKLDFLVYYLDIDSYLNNREEPEPENLKLADFIDFIRKHPDKAKPVVYVDKNISVAKANEKRKRKLNCQDIMVTDTGNENGKVIGYLTDVDIDNISRPGLSKM